MCNVGLHKDEQLLAFKTLMAGVGFRTRDLTNNDFTNDHLLHMIGVKCKIWDFMSSIYI